MAETPETQQQPQPEAGIVQRYEPPPGAIPIARLKRAGIGLGLLALALLTLWGILHKPEPAAAPRGAAAAVQPTTPMEVDSQQAELQREMQEARRAAEQAELAKQRAEHLGADPGAGGPRNAQADPDAQLRTQLRLEELRRRNQAAYASTIAFAPQGARAEATSTAPVAGTASPAQAPAGPSDSKPAQLTETTPSSPSSAMTSGLYRLEEGTVIETILLNRLDGEFSGPVITQVSTDVYSRAGVELLIPKGSRLLGEAREVNSFDQKRLAIVFHRLILPNGKSLSLDKFRGLDQIGETGVVSKVDHHYLEIFGTSLALGGIGGLVQIGAYGGYGYDAATGFRTGFTERMGSSAEQVLAKFLNKLPTIKVLEGTRIKVLLTNDLNVETYE
jgi:type IV secretory pathway VirB10-like protein